MFIPLHNITVYLSICDQIKADLVNKRDFSFRNTKNSIDSNFQTNMTDCASESVS